MNIFEPWAGITRSPEETRGLAEKFAGNLAEGDVVALTGELGAGKTCFAQGLGWGLGVDRKKYLTSPSFTLVKEYMGRMPVYHMDLYRLESVDDLLVIGYEEYVRGEGVTIIEWADKIREFLSAATPTGEIGSLIPGRVFSVNISVLNESERKIEIHSGY